MQVVAHCPWTVLSKIPCDLQKQLIMTSNTQICNNDIFPQVGYTSNIDLKSSGRSDTEWVWPISSSLLCWFRCNTTQCNTSNYLVTGSGRPGHPARLGITQGDPRRHLQEPRHYNSGRNRKWQNDAGAPVPVGSIRERGARGELQHRVYTGWLLMICNMLHVKKKKVEVGGGKISFRCSVNLRYSNL